jgi:SET domain-containing protein
VAASAARSARAPDTLRSIVNDRLEIRSDKLKGRGVFSRAPIAAGTLIEAAPVIIVPARECKLLDQTILHDYYFRWDGDPNGDPGGEGSGAVALGLVALCNHSRRPRARVRRNLAQGTLDLVALAPIAAGDEVTIDYNCPLWFAAQD